MNDRHVRPTNFDVDIKLNNQRQEKTAKKILIFNNMHVLLYIIDKSAEYYNCCINGIFDAFGLHKMILLKPSDYAQTIRRNKKFHISHPKSKKKHSTKQFFKLDILDFSKFLVFGFLHVMLYFMETA